MSGTPELVPLTARGLAFCPPVAGVGERHWLQGVGLKGHSLPCSALLSLEGISLERL